MMGFIPVKTHVRSAIYSQCRCIGLIRFRRPSRSRYRGGLFRISRECRRRLRIPRWVRGLRRHHGLALSRIGIRRLLLNRSR